MRLLGIAFIGRAARADGGGCALDGLDNFLQHHHAETDRDDFQPHVDRQRHGAEHRAAELHH